MTVPKSRNVVNPYSVTAGDKYSIYDRIWHGNSAIATVNVAGEPWVLDPVVTNYPKYFHDEYALGEMFDSSYKFDNTTYHSAYCHRNHGIVRDSY